MLTTKPAVAVGACLDHDQFQGLIEVDKHLIPVVHQSRLGFHGLGPTPNAFPWFSHGSRLPPDSQPETDPRVQQKSGICALAVLEQRFSHSDVPNLRSCRL